MSRLPSRVKAVMPSPALFANTGAKSCGLNQGPTPGYAQTGSGDAAAFRRRTAQEFLAIREESELWNRREGQDLLAPGGSRQQALLGVGLGRQLHGKGKPVPIETRRKRHGRGTRRPSTAC